MCPTTYGFLALFVPTLFLCVPLYMRYYALRPHVFTMSPTDMKLLNQVSFSRFNAKRSADLGTGKFLSGAPLKRKSNFKQRTFEE